jgi:hypothetical protein
VDSYIVCEQLTSSWIRKRRAMFFSVTMLGTGAPGSGGEVARISCKTERGKEYSALRAKQHVLSKAVPAHGERVWKSISCKIKQENSAVSKRSSRCSAEPYHCTKNCPGKHLTFLMADFSSSRFQVPKPQVLQQPGDAQFYCDSVKY